MTDQSTTLCFLDTETTSLSAETGEIWEVGLIRRSFEVRHPPREIEQRWLLPVTLKHADPISLAISRFHERHPHGNQLPEPGEDLADLWDFAGEFAELTHGAHLVGNVVSFDEERLRKLLRANGRVPSWHYHLQCTETLAVGWLRGRGEPVPDLPWNSRKLSEAIGVEMPSDEERHTALGDARWAARIWDRVMSDAS